jgi:hypothetical protein
MRTNRWNDRNDITIFSHSLGRREDTELEPEESLSTYIYYQSSMRTQRSDAKYKMNHSQPLLIHYLSNAFLIVKAATDM